MTHPSPVTLPTTARLPNLATGFTWRSAENAAATRAKSRWTTTPSPTWRSFLKNHVKDLVSIDFVVVPTVRFKVLFVLLVLAHHRRRVVHFNVTEHPSARWTAALLSHASGAWVEPIDCRFATLVTDCVANELLPSVPSCRRMTTQPTVL